MGIFVVRHAEKFELASSTAPAAVIQRLGWSMQQSMHRKWIGDRTIG
jgi:hypothetical protein